MAAPDPRLSRTTNAAGAPAPAAALTWAALAVLVCACSNTVVRPPVPDEPATAFLLDHGQHASLVLAHDGRLARYTYGEWAYYVEGRQGPLRASDALFGANEAGLGRRVLSGPAELAAVRRHVRVRIEHAWRIEIPAGRARALSERFDALFAQRGATPTYNARYDLTFVRHPATYWLGHNSNHVTGEWLRALGCEVTMRTPFSVWSVESAPR